MVKFKNNKESADTWCGMEIQPAAYYEIQTVELIKWQNDSKVLTDIGSADGIINDGSDDITDVATAINFLKEVDSPLRDLDGVALSRQRAFANADGFRFRGKGIPGTATKTTTTNIDYKLTETRFTNGIDLIVKDSEFGDSVTFQVVDIDNILGYGANTVLDEFGTDWYIASDTQNQGQILIPYPAQVITNLYIRIKYTSVGTSNDVQVRANLFLHKKV